MLTSTGEKERRAIMGITIAKTDVSAILVLIFKFFVLRFFLFFICNSGPLLSEKLSFFQTFIYHILPLKAKKDNSLVYIRQKYIPVKI